jgi:hypothetical protein
LSGTPAPTATVYFCSILSHHWSLTKPSLLKPLVIPDCFQALIDLYRPRKPGRTPCDCAISIFLFATLLNLWTHFTDDISYISTIFLVVPNLVFPICNSTPFPYDEFSLLSVLESVALEFVQAVSDLHAPDSRIDQTFRDAHFAARLVRMREEREAASRRRTAELERLYSAEMRALEDVSEQVSRVRREMEGAERDSAGIAGQIRRQSDQQSTLAQQMDAEIDARGRRIAELAAARAEVDGRRGDLEGRLGAQREAVAERERRIAELAEGERNDAERIAELEAQAENAERRLRGQGREAVRRWREAAELLLGRPDGDPDLSARLSVAG